MANIALTRNNTPTPFGTHGRLHIEGPSVIDKNGNVCQLKGLSSHNMSSYPQYINDETITSLVDDFGIEIFRFAMYSAEADGDKGYADGDDDTRAKLEKMIVDGVETCAKLGIYALVDWHILFDHDPNMHTDMAIAFWKSICPKLKEYDNVLIEICNEPNMDTTWAQITNFANEVIPVIKGIDDTKIIIVGTPIWSQRLDEAAAAPLSFDNIAYTLHFYADTHRDDLRKIAEDAIEAKFPVFVTEFGICDASGNGPVNDEQTNIWINLLLKYNISYVLWNLSNKDETSAILKPSCSKISNFTDDDLTPCGLRLRKYMLGQIY